MLQLPRFIVYYMFLRKHAFRFTICSMRSKIDTSLQRSHNDRRDSAARYEHCMNPS